jgi:DNA polymerase III subunit alpha
MDSLGGHRAQLMAALDRAIEAGQKSGRDRAVGQAACSPWPAEEESRTSACPTSPPWEKGKARRRKGDARLLRHRPSARDAYRDKVEELDGFDSSANLAELGAGTPRSPCAAC